MTINLSIYILLIDSNEPSQLSNDSSAALDSFYTISSTILLLIVVCVIVALVVWLVKRRATKHKKLVEPTITFSALQEEDESVFDDHTLRLENTYQEVQRFDLTVKNPLFSLEDEENDDAIKFDETSI